MNLDRPLRGSCHCGRNLYIIQFPKNRDSNPSLAAQVLFDSRPSHRSTLATPLPTYLRVPLAWYHTLTVPQNEDETRAQITRVYHPPREPHAMRRFCGFCGTPLSYWSEEPRGEADFIRLTLGSLLPEDLGDLEEWGVLPSSETSSGSASPGFDGGEEELEGRVEKGDVEMAGAGLRDVGKGIAGEGVVGVVGALPWFDALTEGSRLGTLRRARGGGTDRTGRVRVEWEVVEWTEDDAGRSESPRKRKLDDLEGVAESLGLEGMQQ